MTADFILQLVTQTGAVGAVCVLIVLSNSKRLRSLEKSIDRITRVFLLDFATRPQANQFTKQEAKRQLAELDEKAVREHTTRPPFNPEDLP